MIVCPVCKKKIVDGYICTECGHDESRNVESYLSLVKIPRNVKTLSEEIEVYQNKMLETRLCILMEDRMRVFNSQIKKMENQILEQKKRLEELETLKKEGKQRSGEEILRSSRTVLSTNTGHTVHIDKEISKWSKGGIVTFGKYTINGKDREPIEWLVLDEDDGKYLLLSRYGLDIKVYNNRSLNTTWENSSLRIWLNEVFYRNAFSEQEKQKIITIKIHDNKWLLSPVLGYSGNDDDVFLLSTEEVSQYLKADDERKAEPTHYAKNSGFKMEFFSKYGKWWLRSQGNRATDAAFVTVNGNVNDSGMDVRTAGVMVRPAIWVVHENQNA